MRSWFLSIFICLIFCSSLPVSKDHPVYNDPSGYIWIDSASVKLVLKNYINQVSNRKTIRVQGQTIYPQNALVRFYKDQDYFLGWNNIQSIQQMIECLDNAWKDGLLPDDYHLEAIRHLYASSYHMGDFDPKTLAKLDILLTDAALLYAYHLRHGRLKRYDLQPNRHYDKWFDADKTAILRAGIQKKTIKHLMEDAKPHNNLYYKTANSLVFYEKLYRDGKSWPKVACAPYFQLEQGESNAIVPYLRKRLAITHDYRPTRIRNDSIYDEELEHAVKRFQYRHGLNEDGIVGVSTVEKLGVPLEDKIAALIINLERARWNLHDLEDRLVVVNIPAYQLFYIENDELKYETRVIVGQKDKHTPELRSHIEYIVFNPYWHVPRSIATKEILPILKQNPAYLKRQNMDIYNSEGEALNPYKINFRAYTQSDFPYRIEQKPGKINALGKVKYIFPNRFGVYLHDTPMKRLFKQEQRTYSHGCMRVQNAMDLTYFLIQEGELTEDEIAEYLIEGETIWHTLQEPVQVIVTYVTAFAIRDDIAFFYEDPYEKDPGLYYHSRAITNYILNHSMIIASQ